MAANGTMRPAESEREGIGPTRRLIDVHFDHVALRVTNYDKTVSWYETKLGFQIEQRWRSKNLRLAYLTNGNATLEIIAGGDPEPSDNPEDLDASLARAGYHHFCLSVEDLEATLRVLASREVPVVVKPFEVKEIGRRLAFIKDNNGNMIELAQKL